MILKIKKFSKLSKKQLARIKQIPVIPFSSSPSEVKKSLRASLESTHDAKYKTDSAMDAIRDCIFQSHSKEIPPHGDRVEQKSELKSESDLTTPVVFLQTPSQLTTALVESKQEIKASSEKSKNKPKVTVKTSFFEQSRVVDTAIARQMLTQQEVEYKKLSSSILFRGDTRPDYVVFSSGLYRKIEDKGLHYPTITNNNESRHLIACSKKIDHAIGFADCPTTDTPKGMYSWVYMLYSPQGIDITGPTKNPRTTNMGELVQEVALTHVPPQNIIAAIKIRTTRNELCHYHRFQRYEKRDYPASGRTPIVYFSLNKSCELANLNKELYDSAVEQFYEYYKKGFYQNPWAQHDKLALYGDSEESQIQKLIYGF